MQNQCHVSASIDGTLNLLSGNAKYQGKLTTVYDELDEEPVTETVTITLDVSCIISKKRIFL